MSKATTVTIAEITDRLNKKTDREITVRNLRRICRENEDNLPKLAGEGTRWEWESKVAGTVVKRLAELVKETNVGLY